MKDKRHFEKRCAFCHERKGHRVIGPNLTDNHYIYGPIKKAMSHIVRNNINLKPQLDLSKR